MGIREKIFFNFRYKVIVFLLSALLWFFVKTEDNYKYTVHIPLRVANLGEDRIIKNSIPEKISVNLWGKGRSLISISIRNDLEYLLDLSHVVDSANIILDKENIRSLRETDIEVLNIEYPQKIFVKLEHVEQKTVPIVPRCKIETLPGYTIVGKIVVVPDTASVRGPVSELRNIDSIYTERKEFKKVKRDINKSIKIVKPEGEHLQVLPKQVRIFADVQELMEKRITEIPVAVINAPPEDTVIVIPSTLSLVLEGGADQLLNVTKDDVKAYIDYEKVKMSHEKDHLAYIDPPDGTRYRDVHPTRFKIAVMKKNR